MKKKWLGITLALLVVVVAAVAAVMMMDDTKAEASDYPITISVDSVEIPYGEDIVVNFSGMLESLYYDSATGKWHDIELRLVSGHGLDDTAMKASRWDYTDLTNNYSGGTKQDTTVAITESGTRSFPKDGYGNIALNPGQYSLAVYDYSANAARVSNLIEITVYAVTLSVEKTDFYLGEPIYITYSGLTEAMYVNGSANDDMELRLDTGHGYSGDKTGVGATGCIDLTYDPLNNSANCWRGESATVFFGAGGHDNANRNGSTKTYAAGEYTLWVFDYKNDNGDATDARTPISNRIEITIHNTSTVITTEKTVYKVGEPIAVNYYGLKESRKSEDLELRLDSGHNIANYASGIGSVGFVEMTMDEKDGNKDIWRGENSTVTFPTDDSRVIYNNAAKWPYAPGKYTLWIMDYSPRIAISNVIEITIEPLENPTITIEDDDCKFIYGEDITISYTGADPLFLSSTEQWVSIAILAEGDVVGQQSSKAEHLIWTSATYAHKNPSGLESATITFPDADNDRNGEKFPLPVGKYYAVFRVTNTAYDSTIAEFEVVAPTATVQPELKNSIAMHYTVEYGDNLVGDASMKFTFNGESLTIDGTSVNASKSGMSAFTFTFDNILPQQMGDDIVAELIVNGKVVHTYDAYSLLTYATNKLASTKPEDVAAHDVIIAMLNYGAEAQVNFGYKTDALVNAGLSDIQKELTDITGVTGVTNKLSGNSVEGYAWKAATLDLQSTLAFRFKFEAADISKVVFKDASGNSWNFQDNSDCFLEGANNVYYFYYKNIMAHQFADETTITMYVDDVAAQSVTYSVNTYISYIGGKTDSAVKNICQALYAYGLAANNYNG